MAKLAYRPSSVSSNTGRSVLTWLVRSHWSTHSDRSRPELSSSGASRSASVVLPYSCVRKYRRTPARNSSRPT